MKINKKTFSCQVALLFGLAIGFSPMNACAVPILGFGEALNIVVDQSKNSDNRDLFQTQDGLVKGLLKEFGLDYNPKATANALKKSLTETSSVIDGSYESLKGAVGNLEIKRCGENADTVISGIEEAMTVPGKMEERLELTESKIEELSIERAKSLEKSATTGLAKAWKAQTETANVAEAISKTSQELGLGQSSSRDMNQLEVIASIIRLQEETYKNMNTRLSLMSEDAVLKGLMALETNQ